MLPADESPVSVSTRRQRRVFNDRSSNGKESGNARVTERKSNIESRGGRERAGNVNVARWIYHAVD